MSQPEAGVPLPDGTRSALGHLLDAHLAVTRRFARAIRAADPGRRSKRPDEAVWCCAAIAAGALRGEPVTHKDLVVLADGRLSSATLSRAVQDAVLIGMLRQEALPGNRRVKRLILTEAGWRMLAEGAAAGA